MCDVCRHLQYSATRSTTLKEVLKSLDIEMLKLAIPGDTRWLSLDRAVQILMKILPGVIAALHEMAAMNPQDKAALSLANILSTKEFISTLCLLADVLPVLTTLSVKFQAEVIS